MAREAAACGGGGAACAACGQLASFDSQAPQSLWLASLEAAHEPAAALDARLPALSRRALAAVHAVARLVDDEWFDRFAMTAAAESCVSCAAVAAEAPELNGERGRDEEHGAVAELLAVAVLGAALGLLDLLDEHAPDDPEDWLALIWAETRVGRLGVAKPLGQVAAAADENAG